MTEKTDVKQEEDTMYAAESFILRASIVLGLVAAVMTILYFTPYPDEYFVSCDRPCHELDWPMICRVQLTLEPHQIKTSSCEDCTKNETNCDPTKCPIDDGKLRGVLSASLQVPGPPIQVCHNDVLVVDVVNKIPGQGLTIHWRGQTQHEAPFMDGVPMITQCPVSSFTTFQYKFRATQAGTHIWHAHSGSEANDGFHGALIVRQADRVDPHKKHYDIDHKDNVIFVSQSTIDIKNIDGVKITTPKALLINGKVPSESPNTITVYNVKPNKRYRFRMAYSGSVDTCPVTMKIDNHLMKVIALDGNSISPYEVSSISFSKGERVDFVLKTNHEPSAYFIRFNSVCNDNRIEGLALIKYEGHAHKKTEVSSEENISKTGNNLEDNANAEKVRDELMEKERQFDTDMCESVIGKVCAADVHSLKKMPPYLKEKEVDKKIYLAYDYQIINQFEDTTEQSIDDSKLVKIYRMNNITFTYPSSPLLTQAGDVSPEMVCNPSKKPRKCSKEDTCECVHVEEIPLGSTVEVLLIDQGGDADENIFHLHGYKFFIVGHRVMDGPVSLEEIKQMDEDDTLLKRNFGNPVLKDTIRVPRYGVVALRFQASNPGYWMLRDESAKQWSRGMDVVLRVGGTCDVPATPSSFPQCGSWVGPDFFLA